MADLTHPITHGSAGGENNILPDQDFEILKLLYNEYSCGWRHYDSHIWQIPSLAIAVNGFLIAQTFNRDLIAAQGNILIVRAMMVFIAALFTFVLLVALVKHRLHQRAKDKNIQRIEAFWPEKYRTILFNFRDARVLKEVEPYSTLLERWLAPAFTNHWLMAVMVFTVVTDLVIMAGILARSW